MSVEGKTHSDVVAAIKAGGRETRLLVVDPDADAFFKKCKVRPTSEHLTGETVALSSHPCKLLSCLRSRLGDSPPSKFHSGLIVSQRL